MFYKSMGDWKKTEASRLMDEAVVGRGVILPMLGTSGLKRDSAGVDGDSILHRKDISFKFNFSYYCLNVLEIQYMDTVWDTLIFSNNSAM
jgi:hypothetical protein